MVLRCVAALLAGMLLTACGGPAPAPGDTPAPTASASGAPELSALAACQAPPAPAADAEVEGLSLPDGAVVTKVTPQKPLITVNAYVPMTPAAFESSFQDLDGVKILFSENEIYEAEMLISNGAFRNFHKATATCRNGSTVMAVVAPEVDAKGLPLPAGATATPKP